MDGAAVAVYTNCVQSLISLQQALDFQPMPAWNVEWVALDNGVQDMNMIGFFV